MSNGIKFGNLDIDSLMLGEDEVDKIYFGDNLIYESTLTPLCFTANTAGSTIELCKAGSPSIANTAYSTDGNTWTTFTPSSQGTNVITLTNVGDKVYFRNDITGNFSTSNRLHFYMTGSIAASGNCNSLYSSTGFNELTTLSYNYCFYLLFYNCTSLTTAPSLPATTLAYSCYNSMFQGCTSLNTLPALPATTLANYCYYGMFQGCISLTTAPSLPATHLWSNCYQGMFRGCTSLNTILELPATTLANSCYYDMFYGCTSLNTLPALPATTLADSCYYQMFSNCSNIKLSTAQTGSYTQVYRIPTYNTGTTATIALSNMFSNTGGTFTGTPTINTTYYTTISDIPLYFIAKQANSTIELCKYGSPSIANTAYSYDRITWTTFTPSATAGTNVITLANIGDKVYFRNNITANFSTSNYLMFKMTGSIAGYGNINSLYSATNFNDLTTLTYTYCYYYLFHGCVPLIVAPKLSATILSNYCYAHMFAGCTNLTATPELPSTTLAEGCYFYMFASCNSLTTTTPLLATTAMADCYAYMFCSCSSLTTPPDLPATTLASSCYNAMFSGCSSLTTAPALSATTLKTYCYSQMFYNCTSLTTAPTISATTLATYCCSGMFSGCTSLIIVPKLSAVKLVSNCYAYMFYGCTSLYVSDSSGTGYTTEWKIPTSLTFANPTTYNQTWMFKNCLGTRSSDDMSGAYGTSHTYYTNTVVNKRDIIYNAINSMSSPSVSVSGDELTLTFTPFTDAQAEALSTSGIGQIRLLRRIPGNISTMNSRNKATAYFLGHESPNCIRDAIDSQWFMPQVNSSCWYSGECFGNCGLNPTKAELMAGSLTRDISDLPYFGVVQGCSGMYQHWREQIGYYNIEWYDDWKVGFVYFDEDSKPTIFKLDDFTVIHAEYLESWE